MKKVTLVVGDGIGPEIVQSIKEIFKAADVDIQFEELKAGIEVVEEYGTPLPEHVLESIKKNKVALKAPLGTPIGKGFRSVNVQLRKELNLYSNVRPVLTIPGVKSKFENVDMVIIRENTEGLYSGVEEYTYDEEGNKIGAVTKKIITEEATRDIAKYAFDYAVKNGRKKVTIVHKANIQKFSDGMFLEIAREVAKDYPQIEVDDKIVDNMQMQLMMYHEYYDMLLCPNFYGDIISDLGAGMIGGLGVAPGANIGKEYAVFEAVHGTAPDIAGQGKANPTALLMSAIMMLRHMDMDDKADMIDKALKHTLNEGTVVTGDLGGSATTTEFTQEIIKNL